MLRCGTYTHGVTVAHHRSAPRDFVGTDEVDSAVDCPTQGHPESQQRFQFGAISHERPDQVECHARQVRQEPEYRDDEVAQWIELGMFVEGDHASRTA